MKGYRVRFEVLTVAVMKTAVVWVLAPCSLAEFYWRFIGACCFHHQDEEYPDDGLSKHLWSGGRNVECRIDCMVLNCDSPFDK
jgi:hypothetical protein